MAYYGVGLTTAIQEIVFRFRNHVAKANPYCTVSRIKEIFNKYDLNGNGKLNLEELDAILKGVGLYLKIVELQAIIKQFDKDGDKMLSFPEFLAFVMQTKQSYPSEPMNDRRRVMVIKVFDSLGNQSITQEELRQKYRIQGMTETMRTFINNINVAQSLNIEEFIQFHEELSMNIASDSTFTQLLSKAWNIDEKQEDTAFQQLLLNSLDELKLRVLSRAEVIKVFNEFDSNQSSDLSLDEFLILLKKLQLDWDKAIINKVYRIMDMNDSGSVEKEEFCRFFQK